MPNLHDKNGLCSLILLCLSLLPISKSILIDGQTYPHRTALFGPQAGKYNVSGELILADPEDFCTGHSMPDAKGKIMLIKRSTCLFYNKASTAQKNLAAAVIIGNNQDNQLILMSPDTEPRNSIKIPSVFVSLDTYTYLKEALKDKTLNDKVTYVTLDEHGEVPINEYDPFQIAITLLLILPLLWCGIAALYVAKRLFTQCRDRRLRFNRSSRMPLVSYSPRHKRRSVSLDVSEMDDHTFIHNDNCAICLEDFSYHDSVKLLPCDHGFHPHCLDPWLERSDLCPICKTSILTDRRNNNSNQNTTPINESTTYYPIINTL